MASGLINRLLKADVGRRAVADLDLATAVPDSFALLPHNDMLEQFRRDYTAMQVMIFGVVPSFDTVM